MSATQRRRAQVAFDLLASHQGCFWAMPHRDRHQCDCICVLPRGHEGRHYCQVQLGEFAASLIAEGVTS